LGIILPVERIRVLVADENVLLRAGIRSLLEKIPNIEVAGESGVSGRLFTAIRLHRPDVLLIEIGRAGLNGVATIAKVVRQASETGVVVLSNNATEEFVVEVLNAGASGFLLKRSPASELEFAIRAAAERRVYISASITKQVSKEVLDMLRAKKSSFQRLTHRQREILRLIAEGRNTKEIAILTRLSAKTVAFHRVQLMTRLQINNVVGLARYAIRIGLVSP